MSNRFDLDTYLECMDAYRSGDVGAYRDISLDVDWLSGRALNNIFAIQQYTRYDSHVERVDEDTHDFLVSWDDGPKGKRFQYKDEYPCSFTFLETEEVVIEILVRDIDRAHNSWMSFQVGVTLDRLPEMIRPFDDRALQFVRAWVRRFV